MRPCYICDQKGSKVDSVVYLKTYRLALCKNHIKEWIEKRTEETIKKFDLFSRDDRILTAVSGGKDSLALWWILSELGYKADGIFVDLGIPDFSEQSRILCQKAAEKFGKQLHIIDIREVADETIPDVAKRVKKVCALCGRYKRKAMNFLADKMGYPIVATGHHLLDEAGSLLYNLVNWSTKYLVNVGPKKEKTEKFPAKVKPFVNALPLAIKVLCDNYEIEYQKEKCLYSAGAKTPLYEEFLLTLDDLSPGVIHKFYFQGIKYLKKGLEQMGGESADDI